MSEGRLPLSLNVPVSIKAKLLEVAETQKLSMTDVIIRLIETEHAKVVGAGGK